MKKYIFLIIITTNSILQYSIAQQGVIQLPATGQTTSYYPGDDGDLQLGIPIPSDRFTDNGNGSVTDTFTGLMWVKDANLIATRNPSFDQDRTPGDGDIDWKTAFDYVDLLNNDNYLGHNDWRMPNMVELRSLVNLQYPDIALPPDHPFINLKDLYWSSTTSEELRSLAIGVLLQEHYAHSNIINPAGETEDFAKDPDITGANYWKYYLLPVRNSSATGTIENPMTGQQYTFYPGDDGFLKEGTTWPTPRLVDNNNGTVTDRLTGLMWTKDANLMLTRDPEFDTNQWVDGAINWQHALDYVALLNSENYLGHNDWRMPNRNEMTSLVDISRKNPTLPERNPFSNLSGYNFAYVYWTSTTRADEADQAWIVWFTDGMMGGGNRLQYLKTADWHVWPVRTDNTPLPTSSIHGTITLDGNPYPRAEVYLNGPISGFTRTNLNGEYEFNHLPNGNYTLYPTHKYARFDPLSYSVSLNSSTSTCNFDATYTRAYGWVDISEKLFPVGGAAGGCLSSLWFIGNEGWITNSCSYAEIYHTTDGGETWDVQTPLAECHDIWMQSSEVGYTGGASGLLCKTTDGGQNWNFFAVAPSQIRSIAFSPDGSIGWVGGTEGWLSEITETGLQSQFFTYTDWDAMSFGSNTYGWAVSCFGRKSIYENGVWTYYGGAQYFPCFGDVQFNAPDQAWLSYGGELLRLRNGLFQHLYEDTAQSIQGVFTLDIDSLWAVTTGGDVLMSSNANGDTVHFNLDHLSDSWLTDVFAVDGYHAWAIGNNGSLYRYGLLEGFPAGVADILDFVVDQQVQPAEINSEDQTIQVVVEQGTNLTQLIPEIYISAGATIDPPGGSMQNFSNPFIYMVTSQNGQTLKEWTVTVDITTSVNEEVIQDIKIYPNPAGEIINFQLSFVHPDSPSKSNFQFIGIEVFDLVGRRMGILYEGKPGSGEIQLDISYLPVGIYFIRLKMENQIITKKIIKK
ncbi:MAG: DUF1566 domain-containing protein [Bacteroidetes bacterium]|nr:DUF1566 domain-containing protein [Bacteroidota bacterium]